MRVIDEMFKAVAEAQRWGEPVAIRVGRSALEQVVAAVAGAPPSDELRKVSPKFELMYQQQLREWKDKVSRAARAWDELGESWLWGIPIYKDASLFGWALVVQSQTVFCPSCHSATPAWHLGVRDEEQHVWLGCTHPWHDAIPSPARLIAAGDEAGTVA